MAKNPFTFRKLWEDAQALLEDPAPQLGLQLSRFRRFVHFWVLVGRSFVRNRCLVHASALAYATLLALIPMLAVAVSVTSTFLKKEGEDHIDQLIVRLVATVTPPDDLQTNASLFETDPDLRMLHEDAVAAGLEVPSVLGASAAEPGASDPALAIPPVALDGITNQTALPSFARAKDAVEARKEIARKINHFIQNTRSGALGVTGSILLIFAAISMLSRIETTFNDIWGVARGRSWFLRIVLYWGVISLAPLLVVVALGLASGPHVETTRHLLTSMPLIGSLTFRLLPVVVLCLTFSLFYALIPNTRVDWRAALVGGLAGGLLFHLNNLLSVLYVSRVVSNFKIYGSLGLVPVFMIGLYFCWAILLFGAQVAYAFQNRATYFEEKQVENINQRGREFISLRLMTLICQRFAMGDPPPSIPQIARQIGVPSRLILQIMRTLGAARLVVETAGAETGYLPARPIEAITCHDILLAMRATQGQELATRDEPTRAEVYGEFQRIQAAERQAAASVSMLALVTRAQPGLPEKTAAPEA
jgi:membrane protein